MSNKIVIFDIDDVCMPWAETVHLACVEAGLTDLPTHKRWQMYDDYILPDGTPCTMEQWLEVVDAQVIPGGLYHAPPYPGVVEAIENLVRNGCGIYFVTARGFFAHAEEIKAWTREWTKLWFGHIPYALTFTQEKGVFAQTIHATHSIDDRLKNVEELKAVGVKSYMMNQPHNTEDRYSRRYRVDNVAEFVERVLADV